MVRIKELIEEDQLHAKLDVPVGTCVVLEVQSPTLWRPSPRRRFSDDTVGRRGQQLGSSQPLLGDHRGLKVASFRKMQLTI